MLVGLAAECTATYSFSKYSIQQHRIEKGTDFAATVHSDDIRHAAITTIVFCVLVATLFGADFFFLVFWPRRVYPTWYNLAKLVLAVAISIGMLAAALQSTIVVVNHSSFISGVSDDVAQQWRDFYSRPSLVYKEFPQNIAWVVLLWIATIATLASTVVMFMAVRHHDLHGTEPASEGLVDHNYNGTTTNTEKSYPA
jgi:hypothetical protein